MSTYGPLTKAETQMSTESFDDMSGDVLVAMFHAARKWTSAEMADITNMGMCRNAHLLIDTHVGLPGPQPGDFVFEGTVNGVLREFMVRDYKVVWDRPKCA